MKAPETPVSMTDNEHRVLFQAIRTRQPVNDGQRMCHTSMLGIMGEIVCCTGQQMTWEQVMKSKLSYAYVAIRLGRGTADQAWRRRPLTCDPAWRHETWLKGSTVRVRTALLTALFMGVQTR